MDVDTMKYKEFTSRKQINAYLREMNRFLEKSADFRVLNKNGANLQYSEVQEIERAINRVNKQKKDQWDKLKEMPFLHKGKPTGTTVGQQADPSIGIGDPRYHDFRPIRFNVGRFRDEKEFRQWVKRKEKIFDKDFLKRQNELLKENYILAMQNELGDASKHLQEFIRNVPTNEFVQWFYTENNANINFVYDRLEVYVRLQELERVWGVS